MTIGIAGPMSLELINFNWKGERIPAGHNFPLISYIINGLMDQGIKVVAFTYSSGIANPLVFQDERIIICVGRKNDHPGRSFFALERSDLAKMMKEYAPDIINAQWSYEFAWASLVSGVPTVVTLRDHAYTIFKYFKDPYRFVKLIMNAIVLKKSKYFIANSEYLKDLLKEKERNRSVVINNFYQPFLESYFKPGKKRSNTIISVCNGFDERKNVKNGLKAFQLFRRQYPQYRYQLVGVGMEVNGKAHQYALANRLEENVDFVGYMSFDKVIDMISESDILLHPSREESFGNTILEALVVGTNVVAGEKSGNVPYLLDHGEAGELCDINSPESISASLIKICSDNLKFETYRIKGHKFAVENFSREKVIQKLLETYKDIIDKENQIK